MTLVDIFEHILDGYEFNGNRIGNIISKAEDVVCTGIEKTLEKLTF
jgi:hypothetical protein